MEEKLIEFETARLAKEKGFILSRPLYLYDENGEILDLKRSFDLARQTFILDITTILAPTQSLLQKWLRDVHNIDVYVQPVRFTGYIEIGYYTYSVMGEMPVKNYRYNSWEEALEVGLLEGLKLIE